jgi:hypothetical protein
MPSYNKYKQHRTALNDTVGGATQEAQAQILAELNNAQGRVNMVADFLAFGAQTADRTTADRKMIYGAMLADLMSRKNQPLPQRTFDLCRAIATSQAEAFATQKVAITIPTRFCQIVAKAQRTAGVGIAAALPTGMMLTDDEYVYVSAMTILFDQGEEGLLGALQETWMDDKANAEAVVNTVPMWEKKPSTESVATTRGTKPTDRTNNNSNTTATGSSTTAPVPKSTTPTVPVSNTTSLQPTSWFEQNRTAVLIGGGVVVLGGVLWYMRGGKKSKRSTLGDGSSKKSTALRTYQQRYKAAKTQAGKKKAMNDAMNNLNKKEADAFVSWQNKQMNSK